MGVASGAGERSTFALSLHGAVVAEEPVQQGLLGASGLHRLLLHQPQEAAGLVRPRQRPHLRGEELHLSVRMSDTTVKPPRGRISLWAGLSHS